MKFCELNRQIQKREKPKDIFITPIELAKKLINLHEYNEDDIWLDPFKNSGNFYNNFPTNKKEWCEILDGKDFFEYNKQVSIISSNPPYSLLDKVLEHTANICSKEFGYLIGIHNLTPRRIERLNNKGFFIKSMEMFKVWKWFGLSVYIIFSKEINQNIITFNRTIWGR